MAERESRVEKAGTASCPRRTQDRPSEWHRRSCCIRAGHSGVGTFGVGRVWRPALYRARVDCALHKNVHSTLTLDIGIRYDRPVAKSDVLQGTLDLLILRTLNLAPLHGIGIADRIERVTRGVLVVGPGSLFPALHRLAEKGWIEGEWGELEKRPPRQDLHARHDRAARNWPRRLKNSTACSRP